MLSEELFFVDIDPAVDMYDICRHDHLLCQGRAFLGITKRAPLEGKTSATINNDDDVDPCAAVLRGCRRAWCKVMDKWANKNGEIVYTRRNWASNISLKTFSLESGVDVVRRLGMANDNNITCTTSIDMFRVVSTMYGRHAEYEVHVTCGGRRWVSWERFTNFKSLASTCAAADIDCNETWGHVVMAKPARRCLSRTYLALKCRLLEEFLRQALFAMPTPEPLIQFVTRNHKP